MEYHTDMVLCLRKQKPISKFTPTDLSRFEIETQISRNIKHIAVKAYINTHYSHNTVHGHQTYTIELQRSSSIDLGSMFKSIQFINE